MQTVANSRFGSPRFRRRALWIGGALLVVGVAVGAIAAFWPTPKSLQLPTTTRPAQIAPKEKSVPLEAAAKVVGEQFIETAVARKNLAQSWTITAPALRGSFTLKRWKTGAIPVIP